MISKDKSMHFTVDVKSLTPQEKQLEQRIFGMRDALINVDESPLLMEVHDGIDIIKTSSLTTLLKSMPKGAHLHFHIESSLSADEFFEFTKDDSVYYSFKDDLLKTAPKGMNAPGYEKCNILRANWNKTGSFDDFLRQRFILSREETKSRVTPQIWKFHEHKFSFIDGLVHYHKFYKLTLLKAAKKALQDGIRILEIRHAFGRIFNDNCGKVYNETIEDKSGIACIDGPFENIPIKEELEMYREVISEIKKQEPDFELLVIAVAFKSLGHKHAIEQISSYSFAIENEYEFVRGYDIVNEEDRFEPVLYFIDELLDAKQKYPEFEFYFHTGETISRYNENLYDAILLGTKRIGHSIPLSLHPYLANLSRIQKKIGIEICPITHWILGYVQDPRWHPARSMIASNLGVTVSSDIHTFYNHDALTVDFVVAFLSWELDLADLKQLGINSIKYSSISIESKQKYLDLFEKEWNKFIDEFISLKTID